MFRRASRGGRRGSESWEDKVGEEIDVEDWQKELGGRQTEPVRSQVREESSEGGSVGGRDTDFERGLLLARRISTALQDWSREG
jgi:hypothetical protein